MRRSSIYLFFAILLSTFFMLFLITLTGCSGDNPTTDEPPAAGEAAYFNSFETPDDTSGWLGEGLDKFADDHSPEGGRHSLHIAGGCPQPAASFEISSVQGGNYKISFWAKMGQPEQTSTVLLGNNTSYASSSSLVVTVKGEEWKYYESENYLAVPHEDILRVEFFVGGFVFADVYIDNLKIEKL